MLDREVKGIENRQMGWVKRKLALAETEARKNEWRFLRDILFLISSGKNEKSSYLEPMKINMKKFSLKNGDEEN